MWGLHSHYFRIIGDGHQSNSRGLFSHCKDFPVKGEMAIPKFRGVDRLSTLGHVVNSTSSGW